MSKEVVKVIESVEKLGKFFAKYTDEPLEVAAGIVKDKLAYMRWERQVRLIDKANEFLRARKLENSRLSVPAKFAIPLLQSAVLEEDDDLQDLWANLLVSASDPKFSGAVDVKYVSLLKEMSSLDVLLFNKICQEAGSGLNVVTTINLPEKADIDNFGLGENDSLKPEIQLSLENMLRLGLIRNETLHYYLFRVRVSILGFNLYNACTTNLTKLST